MSDRRWIWCRMIQPLDQNTIFHFHRFLFRDECENEAKSYFPLACETISRFSFSVIIDRDYHPTSQTHGSMLPIPSEASGVVFLFGNDSKIKNISGKSVCSRACATGVKSLLRISNNLDNNKSSQIEGTTHISMPFVRNGMVDCISPT